MNSATSEEAEEGERIRQNTSSTAGAGSGEFHTYRLAKRKEEERLREMDEEYREEQERKEFEQRKAQRQQALEEVQSKKKEKRKRKREKEKTKKEHEKIRKQLEQEVKKKLGDNVTLDALIADEEAPAPSENSAEQKPALAETAEKEGELKDEKKRKRKKRRRTGGKEQQNEEPSNSNSSVKE